MRFCTVSLCLLALGAGFLSNTESLETILARCCNLGVRWAWDNKTCSRFPSPVPSVATEQQGPCLSTIDACCQRNYRERQCTLGHESAKSGRECSEGVGVGGIYHKDCCEGCKLGLIAGSMGLHCEFHSLKVALGPPWDTSLSKCCLQAGGLSTPPIRPTMSTTSLSSHSTVSRSTPLIATTSIAPPNDICALFPGQLCAQICIPDGSSFKCACQSGFRLLPDGKSCLLDNSIPKGPSTDSGMTQSGRPRPASVNQCPVGFTFNAQTQICDDINECEMNACRKFPYKTCVNTIGSFLCEQTERENEPSHQCPPGYRFNDEAATCVDINECAEGVHICDSTQYCINTPGGFDCQSKKEFSRYNCPAGYKFNNRTLNCEDVDECLENLSSCSEHEVCRNTAGAYDCDIRCRDGFRFDIRLRSCQDENECLLGTHDCVVEKETCVNVPGSYQCHQLPTSENNCPPGYEPNQNYTFLCQDVDECKANYLHTCEVTETCVNEVGGYRCEPPTTDADSTSTEMDEELTDNTIPDSTDYVERKDSITQPSVENRLIVTSSFPPPTNRNQAQVTACKPGFRMSSRDGRGEPICEDNDECKDETACDSTQLCQNTVGSFYCHCRSGFYRDPVTKSCQDVNECQTGQHTCTSSQRCDNSPGSYSCIRITGCGTGYTLNSGTGQCEDDDECLFGNHNCHALGPGWECKNTLGSFRCDRASKSCPTGLSLSPSGDCRPTCTSGFQFNSRGECIDIDECRQAPGVRSICPGHQRCVNTEGSYRCISEIICPAGYETDSSGTRCVDTDECTSGHNCKGNQECINRPGGYLCKCPTGYTISESGDCEDVNECERYGGHVCSSNSDCYNTQGSFRCICKTGFEQGQDDQNCKDVDECSASDQHRLCDQNCLNTWGSFRCTCNKGFTLGPDGRTCQDVDECRLSQGKFLCTSECVNTHGSYKCSCPDGYSLGNDNRSCQDIDECERSSCRSDETCLNTRGGFRCNRLTCPYGYQKEGTDKDRSCKKSTQCTENDADCLKLPLTISKNYLSFTSNVRLGSLGYIDMFTMKGPGWAGAVMHFTLELKNTRAPSGVAVVTRDYFLLRRPSQNQAVISLVRPIAGPQDVELELLMEVYHRGAYAGAALAQVVIVVTAYEF